MRLILTGLAGLGLATTAFAAQQLGEVQPERTPEVVYAKTCGYCHGKNVGPIILGRKLPATYVQTIARQGLNGMPAFRPTEVTPTELAALSRWISKSKPSKAEHGK
jgi:mono/diheme cytochrome c family protein